MGFPGGSVVKNPPAMQERQEMQVWSPGREDPPEKEMATRSSILAWGIPGTEEPGGLQSTELQKVRHNLENKNKGLQNETKQIVGVRIVGLRLQVMVRVA